MIECPTCGETPPSTFWNPKVRANQLMGTYRRMRWMMAHIASHRPVRLVK